MVQTSGQLATLVAQTKSTKLQPHSFFVAWRGVMTLAFGGFPNELVGLKERIQANLGSVLPPENMGSKWPKMTLGALNEGKVLTQKEFEELSTLCTQMSQNLALLSDDFPVTNVSFVVFGCRTLERLLIRADMALAANEGDDDVSQEQIEKVESVLKEQEDKDVYLKEVQKLGHRVNHYKQDHIESTLAIFLGGNPDVQAILAEFRRAVDFLLPGYYTWFDKDALHCTLRCL